MKLSHFPSWFQENVTQDKMVSAVDAEEDASREEKTKPEVDKTEEGCGEF